MNKLAEEQDIQQIQQAVDGAQPQYPNQQTNDVAAAMPSTAPIPQEPNQAPATTEVDATGMQPSMMQGQAPEPQAPQAQEQGVYQDYGQAGYDPYAYSGGGGGGVSADTIADIAEQAVAERLSKIRETMEDVLDFKTTTEAKLTDLTERIKKIEAVIDRLQLSILQKIGEHMQDTTDVKKELQETQKTFKSVHNTKTHYQPQHTPTHHPTHSTHNKINKVSTKKTK